MKKGEMFTVVEEMIGRKRGAAPDSRKSMSAHREGQPEPELLQGCNGRRGHVRCRPAWKAAVHGVSSMNDRQSFRRGSVGTAGKG